MARRTAAEERAHRREVERLKAADRGDRFAVVHGTTSALYAYYPTMAVAEANRDRMIRDSEKPLPDDFHSHPGEAFQFWAYIEIDGVKVPGSDRSCHAGVTYPEPRKPRPPSRRR